MRQLVIRYIFYFVILFSLMFILGINVWAETWPIFLFNIYSSISSAIIIYLVVYNRFRYSQEDIFKIVFWYSLISVMILNFMFYTDHGNFFQYQSSDEQTYHRYSLAVQGMSFLQSLNYFLKDLEAADLGALFYVSTIYRFIESTLLVNFVNVICGALSAKLLFNIGKKFMSVKYAFAASLSFFIASYIFRIESSGLKESIFVLMVLATFYHFIEYNNLRKRKSLFWVLIFGSSIMLFRPAVLGMILFSFSIGIALNRYGSSTRNILISGVMLIAFLFMSSSLDKITKTFTSFGRSVEIRTDVTSESGVQTTVLAAALASFIGPLPNLVARVGKENNSIYASGLLFRVLLGVPFWFGIWYIIRNKLSQFYPFVIMSLSGLGALLYILESYELRYHLTHFPFIYLIAFYYLSKVDSARGKIKVRLVRLLEIGYAFVMVLVFFWNLRIV